MHLRILLLAGLLTAASSARIAVAQTTPETPPVAVTSQPSNDFESWETSRLVEYAADRLKKGRDFDKASAALRVVVRREPGNLEAQVRLGCALASRFASLSFAQSQSENDKTERANYAQRQAQWEKAQADRSDPQYGALPPVPPPPPMTPDDGKPFTLTPEEARRRRVTLGNQSVETFETARKLAAQAAPERRSKAEYLRGWCLFLLRQFGGNVAQDRPARPDDKKPTASSVPVETKEIVSCFRQCTVDEAKKAGYWQSLGLALVPKYLDPAAGGGFRDYAEGKAIQTSAAVAEAVRAYQRALALKPGNFDLLYQLALISAPSSPADSIATLEKAAQAQSANAVVWYLLASQRFRQADGQSKPDTARPFEQKAVAAVQSGNAAPGYWAVPFVLPVPPELQKAWDYRALYGFGDDGFTVQIVSYHLSDYISDRIAKKESGEILPDVQTLMAMGLKVVGNSQANDLSWSETRGRSLHQARLTMGLVTCYKAYGLAKKAQAALPDEETARYLADSVGLMKYLDLLEKRLLL